jgi:hypothetical protein
MVLVSMHEGVVVLMVMVAHERMGMVVVMVMVVHGA